jgi:PAS domain S-box-containing protein
VEWYEGARRLKGYEAEEVIGRHVSIFYTPEDIRSRKPEREMATALAVGRSEEESWRVRKDGSRFWGNEIMVPLVDEHGVFVGFTKITRDLTERKQMENALRESEERQRLLIEDVKEYAIFMTDPQGNVVTWNTGAERLLGYSEAEILGRSGKIIFTPEDRETGAADREFQTAMRVGQAMDERWHLRKDGSRFWASGVLTALRDETGQLRGFSKVMRDNTERRRWEEELRASRDELEVRVGERTAALAGAVEALRAEVQEREQAEVARQELMRRLVAAQEEERRRIALELHDQTGQNLTALILGLTNLMNSFPSPEVGERVRKLSELAKEIGQEVHHLAWDLRPISLDQLGLKTGLVNYVEDWSERSGISAEVQGVGTQPDGLPPLLLTTLFRIVQEALTNILKHSQATQVGVIIEFSQRSATVIVEDNGIGFDVEALMNSAGVERRLGLVGMRERMTLIGGDLAIESTAGSGTTVFARVPLAPTENNDAPG